MTTICNEEFLDDVVRVRAYRFTDNVFSGIPLNVHGVGIPVSKQLDEKNAVLDYSYASEAVHAKEGTINATMGTKLTGSGTIYTYNIDSTLDVGHEVAAEWAEELAGVDLHLVLTTASNESALLLAVPGSFQIEVSRKNADTTVKMAVQSRNALLGISFLTQK